MSRMQALMKTLWQTPPTYRAVRWLLPRGIALVYAIAFASWAVQCLGLVGAGGILPAERLLDAVHANDVSWLDFPTLFRWGCSDAGMLWLCWSSVVVALLVMAGVCQRPLLAWLWFAYLSLATTGGVFMGFQWDALLLEAGLLVLFLAPWRWWAPRVVAASPDAPTGAVFLLHWLLFRLMLLSGWVKLGGGDRVWRDCTALLYHFETQPLPHWIAWWAHQLPRSVHVFDCYIMYAIELGLPLLMWCGRWGRLAACAGFTLLMLGVAATGNYNFFNLLTIVLALSLLDDRWWPARLRHWLHVPLPIDVPRQRWAAWHAPLYAATALLILLSLVAADGFLTGRIPGYTAKAPDLLVRPYAAVAGLRSVNAYGLFQDMTDERLEVVVEVSDDGIFYVELPWKWKPSDPTQAPGMVAPHQPRLDWQMWFAVFYGSYVPERDNDPRSPMHWFGAFMQALVEQRESVWALVGEPSIAREKITRARAVLYRYHFTTPEERAKTGRWWRREKLGPFSPLFAKPWGSE